MSWLYRREGERLLAYEREVALGAARSFFVTEGESALFRSQAPESAGTVEAMCNGVDADDSQPDAQRASPLPAGQPLLVCTGAMDYWPNVDAVSWFVQEMLPALLHMHPGLHFHIVGRSPTAAVQALAGPSVSVTGTVPDVRPYLQHAAVVVAPLRLARGIQNKVLEADGDGAPGGGRAQLRRASPRGRRRTACGRRRADSCATSRPLRAPESVPPWAPRRAAASCKSAGMRTSRASTLMINDGECDERHRTAVERRASLAARGAVLAATLVASRCTCPPRPRGS